MYVQCSLQFRCGRIDTAIGSAARDQAGDRIAMQFGLDGAEIGTMRGARDLGCRGLGQRSRLGEHTGGADGRIAHDIDHVRRQGLLWRSPACFPRPQATDMSTREWAEMKTG
jgi:hypothetical protein